MAVWRVQAVVAAAVAVAAVVVVPGWALSKGSDLSSPAYLPAEECKHIRFSPPTLSTKVRESVLQEMCIRAASPPHVNVTKTLKQFAIFLLQRDDFDPSPKWYSGDAKDVLSDQYWDVNELTVLKLSNYQWYVQGLPMWPLPYQAVNNKTSKWSIKKKHADWPNYGIATPLYLASKAWRDPSWSAEEYFQQVKKNSPFKNHDEFHKLALQVVKGINGSQVESYSEWPFLKFSLSLMVKSMTRRNKGICPDLLYIYQRLTPCYPKEPRHLYCKQAALDAQSLLTASSCPDTNIIIGYSKEYNEDEDIRPL